ncbi:hypothetical protein Q3G72_017495 [Acer saccharum]|nr:hypothetical protein Q3G72_017495 [Acer saccharum]
MASRLVICDHAKSKLVWEGTIDNGVVAVMGLEWIERFLVERQHGRARTVASLAARQCNAKKPSRVWCEHNHHSTNVPSWLWCYMVCLGIAIAILSALVQVRPRTQAWRNALGLGATAIASGSRKFPSHAQILFL